MALKSCSLLKDLWDSAIYNRKKGRHKMIYDIIALQTQLKF